MAELAVAMIADDLTGALDAGAPFALCGLKTHIACTPSALERALEQGAEVVCVNTATRELPADAAAPIVLDAARRLARSRPRIVFKKIDSRLKGPIAAEIPATLEGFGCREAIIAPAIPELGRIVADGRLSGHGIAAPIDIAERLGSTRYEIPDTPDQAALAATAQRILASRGTVLAAGARGLASALASIIGGPPAPSDPLPLPRPLLMAIGSRDPITRAQISVLENLPGLIALTAPNGALPATAATGGLVLMATSEVLPSASAEVVANTFGRSVADYVRLHRPATLLLSGGETAASVLGALRIDLLEVVGEALPGIPYCRARLDDRSLLILTKSGGFGAPDALRYLSGAA